MWVVGDVVLERFALVFWRREPTPSGWRQWGVAQARQIVNVPTLVPIGSSVVSLEAGEGKWYLAAPLFLQESP